jgi:hypothetical protein
MDPREADDLMGGFADVAGDVAAGGVAEESGRGGEDGGTEAHATCRPDR